MNEIITKGQMAGEQKEDYQIPTALISLQEHVKILIEKIDKLEKVLYPVLRPADISTENKNGEEELVPLANEIRNCRQSVCQAHIHINDILKRIEL